MASDALSCIDSEAQSQDMILSSPSIKFIKQLKIENSNPNILQALH